MYAHNKYNIQYENMFDKFNLDNFIEECGNVLGNYDDKLIKTYLL